MRAFNPVPAVAHKCGSDSHQLNTHEAEQFRLLNHAFASEFAADIRGGLYRGALPSERPRVRAQYKAGEGSLRSPCFHKTAACVEKSYFGGIRRF